MLLYYCLAFKTFETLKGDSSVYTRELATGYTCGYIYGCGS